jgi:hypothetical protein
MDAAVTVWILRRCAPQNDSSRSFTSSKKQNQNSGVILNAVKNPENLRRVEMTLAIEN